MVGADQRADVAVFVSYWMAAMTTHVDETLDGTVRSARDDNWNFRRTADHTVTGF